MMFMVSRSFVNTSWCDWKLFVLQSGIAADVHYPAVFLFVERKDNVVIRDVWFFVSVVEQPHSGLCRHIFELSRPHTIRHTYSVGLLWTSDEPVAEAATYTNTQQTQGTKIHTRSGIQTRIPAIKLLRPTTLDRMATGIDKVCDNLPHCSAILRRNISFYIK
jgi:hypothetical protein